MWKRLNNNRGTRQSMLIGDPVLQETTLDARDYPGLGLESQTAVPTYQERNREPPQRPSRGELKGLPSLPFEAMPPSPPTHDDDRYRPASSIYSQVPTPINTKFPGNSYATMNSTYAEEDISPPSSPELATRRRNANAKDDDVSPIDETPDISRLSFRPGSRPGSSAAQNSSIPVLRREKRRNQVAAAAANLVQRKEIGGGRGPVHDPRWDPYSGEITTSDRGKPQSVKPGEYTPPALRSVKNPSVGLGNQTEISSGPKARTSFSDRVKNLKNHNAPPQVERPGWKGASGRVALVNPVADQPDIKPLNIPRKSSKRVTSPVASPQSISPVSVIRRDETSNPLTSNPTKKIDQSIRTVHPNRDDDIPDSPISVIQDPVVVPQSAAVKTQARGQPNPRPVQEDIPRGDTTGSLERNFREALVDSYPENQDPYVQPPSRFSISTYAPSTAHPTPRPSTDDWDPPPMPSMPQQQVSPAPIQQGPSPILNRKRPKVIADGSPKSVVSRKAIPPGSPVFISMKPSIGHQKRQSTLSTLSMSKNLPLTPEEAASQDLITSLQAQIDNLQHRRKNIVKSIRQMTELMPQDNITITQEVRRKREDEKRKVEGLREEEAEIRREEHELGLKLHRAWKRKDKDAVYEPTTLWVRRVTG